MSRDEAALHESDRHARRQAQAVFDRPFVLEAGAGTGKTTTLVARIVVWAMGEGWQRSEAACRAELRHRSAAPPDDAVAGRVLERVVAITFTEAAAAEMAERVGRALSCLEQGVAAEGIEEDLLPADPAVRQRRARALLDAVDRLVVRTIHAFCRRLLAAHPLEAGLHPRFEVDADGERRARVVREVVEAHLQRTLAAPEALGAPDLIALATEEMGASEIESALLALLDAGAVARDLEEDPLDPARTHVLARGLEQALDALAELEGGALQRAKRTPVARETSEAIARLRTRLRALPLAAAGGLAALLDAVRELLPDGSIARLEKWARGELGAEEQALLGTRCEALAPAAAELARALRAISDLDPARLERARRVLHPLLAAAEERLRAGGVVGFAALLRATHDLLCQRGDVVGLVRRGIDQLLVDEFQDTDALQCRIVAKLALEGEGPRPGLFLVGDPKQSIYGWRSADLAAYDDFLEQVGAAGGARERLSVSRRSVPAILDEVNRLVEPVMREERGVQPPFAPLVPHPDRVKSAAEAPLAPRVEHWLTWEREGEGTALAQPRAARAVALEAAALARDLVETHARGVPWGEIAVLFRAFSAVPEYLRALEAQGVPYVVQRDRSYAQRREVIEACVLVRAVLDPNDAVALVAWLRSVCVGVPDAAWIPLWARGFPLRVARLRAPHASALSELRALVTEAAAALPADVPGLERVQGWEAALLDALDALAWLRDSFEKEPSDVFVERLRTTLVLEATEGARFLGRFRVANLERFFRELAGWLAEPEADVPGVLRRLRALSEPSRGAEDGPAQDAGEDAVRVLTIHQAKGLDFGHVYLMQLHHEASERSGEEPRCVWHAGRLEYRLLGAPSLGWGAAQGARAVVASAELVRTLYVATTRAKERLVLAGRRPAAPARARSARSHAELIARGRPPETLRACAEAAAAAGEATFELDAARCTVLGLAPPAAPSQHGSMSTSPSWPDLVAVAADAERLRALGQQAAARAARPLRGPASEESHFLLHEVVAAREYGDTIERMTNLPSALDVAPRAERTLATAVGTALHHWLETVALEGDLEAALAASEEPVRRTIASLVPPDAVAEACERARSLLTGLVRGPLAPRLRAVAPGVVARELPVLLPPSEEAGPAGFVAGAIDLVYRDPEDGSFVVADWKTDFVSGEENLVERVRAYAPQGEIYTRAVREALDLASRPRFELWFLHAGRVVVVPGARGAV